MAPRRILGLVLVLGTVCSSMGATYRTPNFIVYAQTQQIAQEFGQRAEFYRREKAMQWLGQEMAAWGQPCPLYVQVTMDRPSGATSFMFGPQGVTSQKMEIQGPYDRLLNSVLPHEITHTVFAYYFRMPVPRWADEGGSVLSEDDLERERHDKLVRQILNRAGQFPLRQLFGMKEYPQDMEKVMCLYAQGFSVSHYLVHVSDRSTFLKFVGHGMRGDWDGACQKYFNARNVQELEATWLKHLRDTKGMTLVQLAQLKTKGTPTGTLTAMNPTLPAVVSHSTAPPAQPLEPVPVIRAQAPENGQPLQKFGDPSPNPQNFNPPPPPAPPTPTPTLSPPMNTWQPGTQQQQPYLPVPVQLNAPQPLTNAPQLLPPNGQTPPVGFPG